jgi:hypothetical protein
MRISLLWAAFAGLGLATFAGVPAPAAGPPGTAEIRGLIDKLGSGSFSEREEATVALDAAGEPALPGLRIAASSDDAEVRRRASELVRKIEHRKESTRLLTPTKVRLSFKDTPLPEAVAELCKQSGCNVTLQDPAGKLKNRRITLSTDETTFWEALDRVCAKGHVMEEGMLPPSIAVAVGGMSPPPAARGAIPPPVVLPGGRIGLSRPMPSVAQLTLVDGGLPSLPTAFAGAVRVRALRTPAAERGDAGHISLNLMVTAEPKLRRQDSFSLRLEKVVDDQGQDLAVATEAPLEPIYYGRRSPMSIPGGFSVQYLQTRLIAGEKSARSLREVRGTLSARLLTEPGPLIAVDDVLKAAGKTVRGKEGGAIKVLEASRTDSGRVSLRLELEFSPDQSTAAVFAGLPVRLRPGRAVPGAVAAGAINPGSERHDGGGLTLLDDKGTTIQMSVGQCNLRRDGFGMVLELTTECDLPAGREAVKLVYAGSKVVVVEIPFALSDIPLP